MARAARKQMADMRALEKQAERSNIVDPREVTTEELLDNEYTGEDNELMMPNLPGVPTPRGAGMMDGMFNKLYPMAPLKPARRGKGATPSMGLSQVRGGAHAEAHAMGAKLRKYLEKLHGGAYAEAFAGGCGYGGVRGGADCALDEAECGEAGGTYFDDTCYNVPESACKGPEPEPEPPKPEERTAPTWKPQTHYKLGEVVYVEDDDRYPDNQPGYYEAKQDSTNIVLQHPGKKASTWKYLGTSYTPTKGSGRMVGGLINRSGNIAKSGSYEGLGRMAGGHCPSLAHARDLVDGKGRARRAPASANDGRRKRADIVKKVMAEKGLKMIQASKYVKEHGLY